MSDQTAGWTLPDSATETPTPTSAAPSYTTALAHRHGLLPLRPLAAGEVLDGAVTVTRAFPRPVLAFAAGIAVVSSLLNLVVTLTLLGPVSLSSSDLATSSDSTNRLLSQSALGTGFDLLITAITQAVMAGIMTAVVGRAVLGTATSLREAWAEVRPRVWRLIGLALLVGLAVYGIFIGGVVLFALAVAAGPVGAIFGAFVLAGTSAASIWLYIRWSLAPAALVLEKQTVRAALKRSTVLVRRSFLRVLGILLLALVITFFVALVVQLPFQLLGYSSLRDFGQTYQLTTRQAILAAVSGAIATTLVAPFTAGVRALLYVDRRMRAEGLDVALVAAAAR
jgi:hypothetical protein